jgi:NHL repeat
VVQVTKETTTMTIHMSTKPRRSATRLGALAVAALAALAALALACAPADAAQTHPFVSSFNGSATPAGAFGDPNGVAVDEATGDVYVADITNNVVDKFNSAGTYLSKFDGSGTPAGAFAFKNPAAVAVDNSGGTNAGDVYVTDAGNNVVDKFGSSGNYLGQLTGTPGHSFAGIFGVGVDSSGDVWVYEPSTQIDEFGPTGTFVKSIPYSYGSDPGFAVDAASNSYTMRGCGCVEKWDSAGNDLGQVDNNGTGVALAVDPTSGHLLVDDGSFVAEWNSSGMPASPATNLTNSGSAQLTNSGEGGIAVNGSSGDIYVANPADHSVKVFGPAATIPDVTTGQASNVTTSAATLNGTVNPDGIQVTDCHFDYGTDSSYGHAAPCAETVGAGTSAVQVHADVTGLQPATVYHFRLAAGNANGSNTGADQSFETTGPPVIDAEYATFINGGLTGKDGSETLGAQVNPNGLATSYHFEYGTTAAYGNSAPVPDGTLPAGFGDQQPGRGVGLAGGIVISGLQLNTLYHYRIVATNAAGTTAGPDQTFTSSKGFGFASFSAALTNQDGSPDTQAGSHPYAFTTAIVFNTVDDGGPDQNLKDLRVDLPSGLVGNPDAAPKCTLRDLSGGTSGFTNCPPTSQIGTLAVSIGQFGGTTLPLYNMATPDNVPAQFGTDLAGVNTFIDSKIRTGGDYGISSQISNLTTAVPTTASTLTLWGVPGDPSHDQNRFCRNSQQTGCSSGAALLPFLTVPTSCTGGQLTTSLSADSWQDIGHFVSATSAMPAMSGCNKLPSLSASLSAKPDTSAADSPSGLSVDLKVPQHDAPLSFVYGNGQYNPPTGVDYSPLATPDLKKAIVTLPQGVSVNPAAANGLDACSPAQIGLDNASEPSCPDAAKIGAVEIDTPLLPDPMKGAIYLAKQQDNPFGSLLAIYVTAEGHGALIKLAGHVVTDPQTGQLTTTFDNNPQLPFSELKLDFFGGSRAALATPEGCGTFTTNAALSPWSGTGDDALSDSFAIGTGCVSGFTPSFTAGVQNVQAGASSPFVLSFSRSDSDQELSGLKATLPPGLLAKVGGVPLCSDADANAGSCPAASQVGTVTTGAGAGSQPLFLPGKAYLTGSYKGAPYGLAVVVPAKAGPFDLGTVVVRQALYIDPTTAQVTAVSDPFPTILDGIPLRLRRVDVNLNRPSFMVNPTSCDPMAITGNLTSVGGLTAAVSSRFQVGGCQELGFSPKLKIGLSGRGRTRSGAHPTLTATLTQPFGQANLHTARVALPLSLALDPNNSQHVCNYDVAQAVHGGAVGCPSSTIVGTATAVTPLLSQPLSGKVYLVQGIRFSHGNRIHTLPSLLIPLRGQIALDLRARSSVNGAAQLVTTFSTIPDAPVSKFTLTITGGKKGLLVITGRGRTICGKSQVANSTLGAQSGKTDKSSINMSTPCAAVHKTRRHAAKHVRRPR